MYPTFQYFLKAYCTLSVQEEEITDVMTEFAEQENQETIANLQHELLHMQKENSWEDSCLLAAKQGNRIWSLEETREHIETFLHVLQNKKA
ncbi:MULTISPECIES: hypothetical protein [Bacillus cereus group]|jgi:hypothetical protein|uniref:hypothetical protein n=1 Tax=Bacillus cereus group TaxID=86661 RepID=UPI0001A0A80F|nr:MULTISPECIES: hypothetical protein [Bacillus cereus group]EEL52170.1 hypothetical protein bcere0022_4970 [Bacillus cereus Rock3-44]PFA18660.1 hypothetical protein CN373_18005 [Bacillus cereus]PFO82891.1 hypothetical protein COJ77_10765 [Bacillus cereus]PGZ18382.1 hypothetical protein COE46_06435 [Bacillus cereus]